MKPIPKYQSARKGLKEALEQEKTFGKRKCKHCKEVFQKSEPLQMCCSIKCAIAYTKGLKEKAESKEWNQRKKEIKEKIKTLADWKNDLQNVVNWIVKELDKDLPCISHPDMTGFLRWDAGHAFTVKAHSDIRFNLHNIHKQNSQSNELYGYCPEYQQGLLNRYGQGYLDMVLRLPLTWNGIGKKKFKINLIRDEYLPNARRIQREMKAGAEFTRDQINEMIGIYVQ